MTPSGQCKKGAVAIENGVEQPCCVRPAAVANQSGQCLLESQGVLKQLQRLTKSRGWWIVT